MYPKNFARLRRTNFYTFTFLQPVLHQMHFYAFTGQGQNFYANPTLCNYRTVQSQSTVQLYVYSTVSYACTAGVSASPQTTFRVRNSPVASSGSTANRM